MKSNKIYKIELDSKKIYFRWNEWLKKEAKNNNFLNQAFFPSL